MIKKYLPILVLILSAIGFSYSVYEKYINSHEWFNPETGSVVMEMTLNESVELVNKMEGVAESQNITGSDIETSTKAFSRIKVLNNVYFLLIIFCTILFYWSLLQVKNGHKKAFRKTKGFEIF